MWISLHLNWLKVFSAVYDRPNSTECVSGKVVDLFVCHAVMFVMTESPVMYTFIINSRQRGMRHGGSP